MFQENQQSDSSYRPTQNTDTFTIGIHRKLLSFSAHQGRLEKYYNSNFPQVMIYVIHNINFYFKCKKYLILSSNF